MLAVDEMPGSVSTVNAQIHGNIHGQVAVGNNILQNNVSNGGVVYVAAPGQTPRVRRRPSRVQLAGRAGPPLLGREAELEAIRAALEEAGLVEMFGIDGSGKTSLLKSVAHDPAIGAQTGADGVVYHNVLAEPVEDTLQSLFEAFYASDVPFKPTDVEVRHALEPIRALLALDDVSVGTDQLQMLLDAVPNAGFVFASSRPRLVGVGPLLRLRGLAEEPALALLERHLGRALTSGERRSARSIIQALDGQPLRLVQVAGVVKELEGSLSDLAQELRTGDAVERLSDQVFGLLSDDQRAVLALLAAMDRSTVYLDNVAELTGIPDVGPVIESLLLLALVQAHSPRFSLTADVSEDRWSDLDSNAWRDRALQALPDWVEGQSEPESVVKEAAAILQALEHGVAQRAWRKVLRLGRAVETPLVLARRWGAWAVVLRHQLEAARGLGDRAAEGWCLHQLGTRALCLGDAGSARSQLYQALRIRESLHDIDGAAATRHNLDFLTGPPPKPPKEPPPKPPMQPAPKAVGSFALPPVVVGAVAMVVMVLGVVMASVSSGSGGEHAIQAVADVMGGELSSDRLDFGDQQIGTTSEAHEARLANTGDELVVVDGVTLSGASPGVFVVERDACTGASVAPGDGCTVSLRFKPSAVGARHATLIVSHNGGTEPVVLRGVGTVSPLTVESTAVDPNAHPTQNRRPGRPASFALAAEPSELSFDEQRIGTTSNPRIVTLHNSGVDPIAVDRVTLVGAAGGDFVVDSRQCVGSPLPPGASCTILVAFGPLERGPRLAAMEIGPGRDGAPLIVGLQGTGVAGAVNPEEDCQGLRLTTEVVNQGTSPLPGVTLSRSVDLSPDHLGGALVGGAAARGTCSLTTLGLPRETVVTSPIDCGGLTAGVQGGALPRQEGNSTGTSFHC